MIPRACLLLLLAVVAWSSRGHAGREAAAPPAAGLPAASELLTRAIEASGGQAAWSAVQSIVYEGQHLGPTPGSPAGQQVASRIVRIVMAPRQVYQWMEGPTGAPLEFGVLDDVAWVRMPALGPMGTRVLDGSAREDLVRVADPQGILHLYEGSTSQQTMGEREVGGRIVYEVRLDEPGRHDPIAYFDRETGLYVGGQSTVSAGPLRTTSTTVGSDFREVAGCRFAFKEQVSSGTVVSELVWTSIRVNEPGARLPELPSDVRELLGGR